MPVQATMADVIVLPTAAANTVPRRRWHGQYPKGVAPISRQRCKRKEEKLEARYREMREAARPVPESTAEALLHLHRCALRHDVLGVVLVREDAYGHRTAAICGDFGADRSRALEAAERLCKVIAGLDR
jgi:hypothetical protein